VLRWLKREGDSVQAGEAVVELETEKVSYELESPIAGTLLKILAEESAQVPVGGKLCHIGQEGDSAPNDSEATGSAGTKE
jgi:pyruvate/2-oxoglutarate dehydrogenase complex dihydrolipoamide acyltransferase (E2) component